MGFGKVKPVARPALRVDGLGKRYRIGRKEQGYRTLRDSLARAVRRPLRALRPKRGRSDDEILWALRDVSFEVRRGDVVGIVGRNGAGKSTLLKILSRITAPTAGHADIRGRVGSLLEVGTGFHPELSGRENIFLNGAILGMGRAEIQRKFDEIVAFASVERFIDTPVKHYSSGMYLRLAFAVAAHLEPEILLVDEVLAVGDAAFQKKCLGRMEAVAHEGRTILFVSHNMGAVRSLCTTGLYLSEGTVEAAGDLNECIARYFRDIGALHEPGVDAATGLRTGTGFGRVRLEGSDATTVDQGDAFTAATVLRLEDDTTGFYLFCILEDMNGHTIFHLQDASPALGLTTITAGDYQIRVTLPPLWLVPGLYSLHFKVMLWSGSRSRYVSDKLPVDIQGISSSATSTECLLHPRAAWCIDH